MKKAMVRTDKWALCPSAEAKSALSSTVAIFRAYCRSLVGIIQESSRSADVFVYDED